MLEGTSTLERSAPSCQLHCAVSGGWPGPVPSCRRVPGRKGTGKVGGQGAVASPQNRGQKRVRPHAGTADGQGHLGSVELRVLRAGLIRSPSLSRVRVRGQFLGGAEMKLTVGPQGRGHAHPPSTGLGGCLAGTGSRVVNGRDGVTARGGGEVPESL